MFSLLAAAIFIQTEIGPGIWECSRVDRSEAGFLTVQHMLAPDGRLLTEEVHWVPRNSDSHGGSAHFVLRGDSISGMRTTQLTGYVRLSSSFRGPGWAVVRIGGRIVARRRLDPDRERGYGEVLGGTISVDFRTSRHGLRQVPQVAGSAFVVLTIEERGGTILARQRLSMPDRAVFSRFVARARPGLRADARDFRRRCRDTGVPDLLVPSPSN